MRHNDHDSYNHNQCKNEKKVKALQVVSAAYLEIHLVILAGRHVQNNFNSLNVFLGTNKKKGKKH